ncbi:hypothetical protein FNV43_RR19914 [Rhamnella rubrinervis]|uniref:Uncharacterized protein n=1 Tax=Rhamnella rubrinervis TaxID=2594499 RepID=A0A8K0DYR1_9ROSA|nr:hypothetical protein FNV43_RR19914 [Rhamnella rubrinervis]
MSQDWRRDRYVAMELLHLVIHTTFEPSMLCSTRSNLSITPAISTFTVASIRPRTSTPSRSLGMENAHNAFDEMPAVTHCCTPPVHNVGALILLIAGKAKAKADDNHGDVVVVEKIKQITSTSKKPRLDIEVTRMQGVKVVRGRTSEETMQKVAATLASAHEATHHTADAQTPSEEQIDMRPATFAFTHPSGPQFVGVWTLPTVASPHALLPPPIYKYSPTLIYK